MKQQTKQLSKAVMQQIKGGHWATGDSCSAKCKGGCIATITCKEGETCGAVDGQGVSCNTAKGSTSSVTCD